MRKGETEAQWEARIKAGNNREQQIEQATGRLAKLCDDMRTMTRNIQANQRTQTIDPHGRARRLLEPAKVLRQHGATASGRDGEGQDSLR